MYLSGDQVLEICQLFATPCLSCSDSRILKTNKAFGQESPVWLSDSVAGTGVGVRIRWVLFKGSRYPGPTRDPLVRIGRRNVIL
jgi:hypothetical protein